MYDFVYNKKGGSPDGELPFYTCYDKFKAVLFYFARDFRLFTKITVPAAARTSRTSTGTRPA